MLATHDVSNAPAFYICTCGYVGQIGVGAIEEFKEEEEERNDQRRNHSESGGVASR